jgi:hypothetical protein
MSALCDLGLRRFAYGAPLDDHRDPRCFRLRSLGRAIILARDILSGAIALYATTMKWVPMPTAVSSA